MYISASTLLTALLAISASEAIKLDPTVHNHAVPGQNATGEAAAAKGQQASGAKEGVSSVSHGGNANTAAAEAKTGAAQVAGGGANTLLALPGSVAAESSLKPLPGLATGDAAATLQSLSGAGESTAGASVGLLYGGRCI